MPRPPSGKVTRRDIARRAGVSEIAVSQALNDSPHARLSETTRARIRQVADALGYRPNAGARALATGRTETVALVQPAPESLFSGLYQLIIHGMARAMQADGYHLLIVFRTEEGEAELLARRGRVDALAFIQSDDRHDHIEQSLASGVPAVVLNTAYPTRGHPRIGSVNSDIAGCVRAMVDELCERGCRHLALRNPALSCDCNRQFQEAFCAERARLARDGIRAELFLDTEAESETAFRAWLASGGTHAGVVALGKELTDRSCVQARRAGMTPGRGFHVLMETSFRDERPDDPGVGAVYAARLGDMGARGWVLLRKLLAGPVTKRVDRVPYERMVLDHA